MYDAVKRKQKKMLKVELGRKADLYREVDQDLIDAENLKRKNEGRMSLEEEEYTRWKRKVDAEMEADPFSKFKDPPVFKKKVRRKRIRFSINLRIYRCLRRR
jgi:hypothetical protein